MSATAAATFFPVHRPALDCAGPVVAGTEAHPSVGGTHSVSGEWAEGEWAEGEWAELMAGVTWSVLIVRVPSTEVRAHSSKVRDLPVDGL
ncbi:hypothetical protein Ato02nite_007270 [Paractinoplanes toevensis]|uniref:Uncharacterized protein n=1 Tax=Paractinoplanes toevensis TaxID=571911 RepID=A0A919T723_9ACTN|nr:hypothetical protein Ato02nite_007270 [Actinoplanes toevensis]